MCVKVRRLFPPNKKKKYNYFRAMKKRNPASLSPESVGQFEWDKGLSSVHRGLGNTDL